MPRCTGFGARQERQVTVAFALTGEVNLYDQRPEVVIVDGKPVVVCSVLSRGDCGVRLDVLDVLSQKNLEKVQEGGRLFTEIHGNFGCILASQIESRK